MGAQPVAIVTGASRGIGKRLCADLAGAGYDVVCTARTSNASRAKLPGTVEETAALVEAAGRRAMPVALDVQDEAAVAALADARVPRVGALRPPDQQCRGRAAAAGARRLGQALAPRSRRQPERAVLSRCSISARAWRRRAEDA